MDKHYIDKKFRKELQGVEANPPVEAWLAISDALDENSMPRRNFVMLPTAAAIAAFIVAAFSFWMIFVNESLQENTIAQQSAPSTMNALPVSGLSDTTIPGALLANLTSYSPQTFYPATSSQPITASQPDIPQRLQASPGAFNGYLQHNAPEIMPRTHGRLFRTHTSGREVYTQMEIPERKSFGSKIILGVHFAPQYNYRTFADRSGSTYRSIPFSELESQIFTFSAGLNAGMALSPSWSIQAGLHLNNMGQYIKGISAYQHPDYRSLYSENQFVITSLGGVSIHDTSRHFADVESYRVVDIKESLDSKIMEGLFKSDEGLTQVFQFVEVPLIVRYKITGHHVGLHIKGGIAGSYLLSRNVYIGSDITQHPIGKTFGNKQLNFSVMGGFAMELPLTGRLSLHMEPTAQLFLQPFVLDGLGTGRVLPYNFSLHTGLFYRL